MNLQFIFCFGEEYCNSTNKW